MRIKGSGTGGSKARKKKKPAPKRKAPTKKGAEARAAIPGYKVPKKLLKNTTANRAAGGDANALFKLQTKEMWDKINSPKKSVTKKKTSSKATPKNKQVSDWERGLEVRNWARGQKKPWQN